MSNFISVSGGGAVTLSSNFLVLFPNAQARIENDKLILENVCRDKFIEHDFVTDIESTESNIFYSNTSFSLIEFTGTQRLDVIGECEVLRVAKYDGIASTSPSTNMERLYDPLDKGIMLNHNSFLRMYLDDEIDVETLVDEIIEYYKMFYVYSDVSTSFIVTAFQQITKDEIALFLENTETFTVEETLATLKDLETRGLMGAGEKLFSQHREGKRYEVGKTGDNIDYVYSTVPLDEETKNEILLDATEIHLETMLSNFGYVEMSESQVSKIKTDWGGDILIDRDLQKATIAFRDDTSYIAPYLLGFALYEVLVRFDMLDKFSVGTILDYENGIVKGEDFYVGSEVVTFIKPVKYEATLCLNGMKLAEASRTYKVTMGDTDVINTTRNFNFPILKIGFGQNSATPNRVLLESCDNIYVYELYGDSRLAIALIENYDVLPLPVKNLENNIVIGSTFLNMVRFSPELVALVLSSDHTQHINHLEFKSYVLPQISRTGGTYTIHIGNERIEVTTGVAQIPSGVVIFDGTLGREVTCLALHKLGVVTFNRAVHSRDLAIPGTTFLSRSGLSDTDVFLNANVVGFEQGTLPVFENIREMDFDIFVNSVSWRYEDANQWWFNGEMLVNALIADSIENNNDVLVGHSHNIREEDTALIKLFFDRVVEAVNGYLFPITSIYDTLPTDPVAKQAYRDLRTQFLSGAVTIENIRLFWKGNTIEICLPQTCISFSIAEVTSINQNSFLSNTGEITIEDPTSAGAVLDGYLLRWYDFIHPDSGHYYNRTTDLRTNLATFHESSVEFDAPIPGEPEPPTEPLGEAEVTYTFTPHPDGSVTVNYIAKDKDYNDITDQFNTLTLGDYFLHKEVE